MTLVIRSHLCQIYVKKIHPELNITELAWQYIALFSSQSWMTLKVDTIRCAVFCSLGVDGGGGGGGWVGAPWLTVLMVKWMWKIFTHKHHASDYSSHIWSETIMNIYALQSGQECSLADGKTDSHGHTDADTQGDFIIPHIDSLQRA